MNRKTTRTTKVLATLVLAVLALSIVSVLVTTTPAFAIGTGSNGGNGVIKGPSSITGGGNSNGGNGIFGDANGGN